MAPRSLESPSPKVTRTFEMFAPVVGVTENFTGVPAVVDGGSAVKAARPRTFTFTVAAALVTVPAVAVIFDVPLVVSVALATPFPSVVAVDGETDPLSVANVTGTPASGLPPSSVTTAE